MDRATQPENLFDAVCQLDDLSAWLAAEGYSEPAEELRWISEWLKGYIVLTLKTPDVKS
jgi:hypothetical protein